ncbi:MAG: hypothetical protein R3F60_17755 [bacterium]
MPDEEAVEPAQRHPGARAAKFPQLDLYNYFFLSNRFQVLLGVPGLRYKSMVLAWVNREISKRINKLRGRVARCSHETAPSR